MALLNAEVTFDLKPIHQAVGIVTETNSKFLSSVGSKSRTMLKKNWLSGQELTYESFGKGVTGKNLITSDVNKAKTQVKIYSFPLNLFEHGRTLRDGRREAPKEIITVKLKGMVASKMGSYVNTHEKKLDKEFDKVGL